MSPIFTQFEISGLFPEQTIFWSEKRRFQAAVLFYMHSTEILLLYLILEKTSEYYSKNLDVGRKWRLKEILPFHPHSTANLQ